MVKRIYNHISQDSLYRNSTFLLASNFVVAGLGFVFWALNTRIYSAEQVGLASTLISTTTLLTVFSLLGLNISLVRYLPSSKRKNDKINSSFTIITIASIFVSIIFLVGLKIFSPKLIFIRENLIFSLLFTAFVVFSSLSETIKNIFRAYRSSEYILIKNTIFQSLKLVLVFLFVNMAAFGIFSSFMVSLAISFLISLIILTKRFDYKFQITIKSDVIKKMFSFSFANYVSEFFERSQRLVLPLMITNVIGAKWAAYFFMAMAVAQFLFMIPEAISGSFFAEASSDETRLNYFIKKTLKAFLLILIPAILITFFFGKHILLFFGKAYSEEGFRLLQIFSISALFVSANSVLGNIAKVKYKMKELVLVNIFGATIILGLSYILLQKSLLGVGWAWLIGQGLMTLAYLIIIFLYKSSYRETV